METCGALRAVGAFPRGAPEGPTVRASLPTGSTIPSAPCANLAPILRFGCVFQRATALQHAIPSTLRQPQPQPQPQSQSQFQFQLQPQPQQTAFSLFGIKNHESWGGADQKKRKSGLGCGEAKAQDHSPSSTKAKAFAKHQFTALLREIPPAALRSSLQKGLVSVSPKPQNSAKPIRNLKKAVCWGVFLVFWRGNCVRTPSVDRAHSGALAFRCPASCPALFRHLYKGWFSRLWPDGSVCGPRHLRQ